MTVVPSYAVEVAETSLTAEHCFGRYEVSVTQRKVDRHLHQPLAVASQLDEESASDVREFHD